MNGTQTRNFSFQNRELNDSTLLVRQRAVMALCEHLHDPEHIAEALRCGEFFSVLFDLRKISSSS